MLRKHAILVITTCIMFMATTLSAQAEKLQITITDVMTGQTLKGMAGFIGPCQPVFVVGSPASVELEYLAEGGLPHLLIDLYGGTTATTITHEDMTPLYPGNTLFTQTQIPTTPTGQKKCLSWMARLNSTNDAFVGVTMLDFRANLKKEIWLPVYDAGTEFNDQYCANMLTNDACGGTGTGFSAERPQHGNLISPHPGLHNFWDSELDIRHNGFNPNMAVRLWLDIVP